MSAQTLRRAAALMRERAEAATDGSWLAEPVDGDVWGARSRERVCRTSSYAYGQDAEHIASWHPAVALAVADWLDEVAVHHDQWAISRGLQPVAQRALTVARAYLGEPA